ncbi:branched-chain amino acid aminotransferase [Paenibacillus sp. MBLB4367]|uniref:branched-chain amino acid aminotransferase n=1 Tax=Paenibacillus sp. MBLB4367 TaxID=3384767 RepID=UPI0039083999
MTTAIQIEKRSDLKPKPDEGKLGFGTYFTDHMFLMDYDSDKGWYDPRIVPYAPLQFDPAAMVFHYGQAVFEGLKAFRTDDDRILLFRPDKNAQRFNRSCERLSIPGIDEELFVEAIRALVQVDADWVPSKSGSSLYIRPFVVATEAALGVRASKHYLFAVILSPVGSYYPEGMKPVNIRVEAEYVRAVRGGIGNAKTSANYASGLKAQAIAAKDDCAQVLWLDGIERKYIEEVGSMNVFFKIGGKVVTPALNGSILDGVTRQSVIRLLEDWNIPVVEAKVAMDDVLAAAQDGTLEEAFGTGTAAVISSVGGLHANERMHVINNGEIGELTRRLYDAITGIQAGKIEDRLGWTVDCL